MCSSSNQSKKNIWFLILCDLFRAQTCMLVGLQGQGVKCCAMCCATCYVSLPHVQWTTCCSIVIRCVMRFVFSAMRSANKLLYILSGVDKFQATNSHLHVLPQWGIMVGLSLLPLAPLHAWSWSCWKFLLGHLFCGQIIMSLVFGHMFLVSMRIVPNGSQNRQLLAASQN